MYLYQRYFLKEFLKVVLLFLSCFYFLYVLIDYSAHTKSLTQGGLPFVQVLLYYLYQFTKQADKLLPFALLLGTVKVLTSAGGRGEILALVSGGVTKKGVVGPLLILATLAALFLVANDQFLEQSASRQIDKFEEAYFKGGKKALVNHLQLEDHSTLLYRTFDGEKFTDLFWIKNCDEIMHMKHLHPKTRIAECVDFIERDSHGNLRNARQLPSLLLPKMHVQTREPLFNPDTLATCALCLLAVLAPAPFCLKFGRHPPLFLLYTLSIFGMIIFLTAMSAIKIVTNEALIALPVILLFITGWRYARL